MLMSAYSGMAPPEPSVTKPSIVMLPLGTSAKSCVVVPPSFTVTGVLVPELEPGLLAVMLE